jgi:hypothetical protein
MSVFKVLRPEPILLLPLLFPAKASDLDHFWSDHIDQQNPELNTCCVVMYVKCFRVIGMTGQK